MLCPEAECVHLAGGWRAVCRWPRPFVHRVRADLRHTDRPPQVNRTRPPRGGNEDFAETNNLAGAYAAVAWPVGGRLRRLRRWRAPLMTDYQPPFAFTGTVKSVFVDVTGEAVGTWRRRDVSRPPVESVTAQDSAPSVCASRPPITASRKDRCRRNATVRGAGRRLSRRASAP
jgi:hypothetical protein